MGRTDDFKELVHDIAMHIAASDPKFIRKEDVTPEAYEKEKDIYRAQAAATGKPANVVEKIVEGKMAKFYEDFLGPNTTIAQRREFRARTMAAETEFWRARRQVAAVMHFCGLAYSKPHAVTSDHFLDLGMGSFEQGEPAFLAARVVENVIGEELPATKELERQIVGEAIPLPTLWAGLQPGDPVHRAIIQAVKLLPPLAAQITIGLGKRDTHFAQLPALWDHEQWIVMIARSVNALQVPAQLIQGNVAFTCTLRLAPI